MLRSILNQVLFNDLKINASKLTQLDTARFFELTFTYISDFVKRYLASKNVRSLTSKSITLYVSRVYTSYTSESSRLTRDSKSRLNAIARSRPRSTYRVLSPRNGGRILFSYRDDVPQLPMTSRFHPPPYFVITRLTFGQFQSHGRRAIAVTTLG